MMIGPLHVFNSAIKERGGGGGGVGGGGGRGKRKW